MNAIFLFFVNTVCVVASSISNPFHAQSKIDQVIPDYFDTKNRHKTYYNNTPLLLHNVTMVRYDSDDQDCNVEINVKWSATIGYFLFTLLTYLLTHSLAYLLTNQVVSICTTSYI